jgi:hypothetical protein
MTNEAWRDKVFSESFMVSDRKMIKPRPRLFKLFYSFSSVLIIISLG